MAFGPRVSAAVTCGGMNAICSSLLFDFLSCLKTHQKLAPGRAGDTALKERRMGGGSSCSSWHLPLACSTSRRTWLADGTPWEGGGAV